MKKLIAFILAMIYITASSGVVLNVHYCMGKISSVKVDNFESTFCKCGKKETNSSCCSTELKVVKLNNDHKAALASFDIKFPVAILPSQVSYIDLSKISSQIVAEPVANAPPIIPSTKIYIQNRVFRI